MLALILPLAPVGFVDAGLAASAPPGVSADVEWLWPISGAYVESPYVAPAHRYGPGHRGIDLRPAGEVTVRAPAAGTVAFAGAVAGRGVLTIDHGGGIVTTFEPIAVGVELRAGVAVRRGEVLGRIDAGGHAALGALHVGARLDGEYINPLLLFGSIPRAVLLPCC